MAARIHSVDEMTPWDAIKVGLVQCVAMIPGTSRSGATIIGGMLLGLDRKTATDFSFYLAIPTLKRVEYLIKPRWSHLTRFPATILVGLQTLLMALVLILPIPFANWPPGMTVAMTSLALLQRDGLLMLLTIPAAIASVASVYLGARVGIAVIDNAIQWLNALFT